MLNSQKGFASGLLVLLLLVSGIGLGTYLVGQKTNLIPNAAEPSSNSSPRQTAASTKPELWIMPNFHQDLGVTDWEGLFADQDQWKQLLSKITSFQFYTLAIREHGDQFLPKAVPLLVQNNIKIGVSGYGSFPFLPCDNQRGEATARQELGDIDKIYNLGGMVTYLPLDDPIARTLKGSQYDQIPQIPDCYMTVDDSIRELVDYMKIIHSKYPEIKIGYITNFPHWQYSTFPPYNGPAAGFGDFKEIIGKAIDQINASGEKLEFIQVDNPYDYATAQVPSGYAQVKNVDWVKRIADLEDFAHSRGLKFSLIYNSDRAGNASNQQYYEETLAFINLYQQRKGIPDYVALDSWYKYPNEFFPINKSYTFSNLTDTVANTYFKTPSPSPSPTPTVTPPTQRDSTPPTVSITSPLNGATIPRGRDITVQATASDNILATKIRFYLNNEFVRTDISVPFSFTFKTSDKRGVSYKITARAYDGGNNSKETSITVTTR